MERVPLDGVDLPAGMDAPQLLQLHEALDLLAKQDPQKARVVELRFFAGLTHEQTAEVLGVSEPTVKRHWNYARAWLFREMHSAPES